MSNHHRGKLKKDRQTLYVHEWPRAEQSAWQDACRPSHRLKKGGSGSHLRVVSLEDYASRYGRFLGFLKRTGRLDPNAPAAAQVTPANVEAYIVDFTGKVSSVAAWNNIYKVRRAAQLLSPEHGLHLAHRDREGPRAAAGTEIQVRSYCDGGAARRSRIDAYY